MIKITLVLHQSISRVDIMLVSNIVILLAQGKIRIDGIMIAQGWWCFHRQESLLCLADIVLIFNSSSIIPLRLLKYQYHIIILETNLMVFV